jgi:5-(carboxyamino)imidazole ribonucleotide synthase
LSYEQWLTIPGATVHLYGKGPPRPGRKMGHVTQVAPAAKK